MRHEQPARQRAAARPRASGSKKQRGSARERARAVSRSPSRLPPATSELEIPLALPAQTSQLDEASLFVGQLLAIVDGTAISELEVDWDGRSVRIRREPLRETLWAEHGEQESKEAPSGEDRVTVTSTSVGVFHRDGAGGLPEPGQAVAAGAPLAEVQTLGIRSPVVAPVDGTLTAVLVDDGTPVEYGQALLIIEPAHYSEA